MPETPAPIWTDRKWLDGGDGEKFPTPCAASARASRSPKDRRCVTSSCASPPRTARLGFTWTGGSCSRRSALDSSRPSISPVCCPRDRTWSPSRSMPDAGPQARRAVQAPDAGRARSSRRQSTANPSSSRWARRHARRRSRSDAGQLDGQGLRRREVVVGEGARARRRAGRVRTDDAARRPTLRTSFTVDRPVRRALIHGSALGDYELHLNGARSATTSSRPATPTTTRRSTTTPTT